MERVVIFRLGSLGDTVVALPCFHLIERAFPDAERIVLTNHPVSSKAPAVESVLRSSGLIHGTVSYQIGSRNPREAARLARALRGHRARVLIYLQDHSVGAARLDVAFFRLCGFRRIIGAPRQDSTGRAGRHGEVQRESHRLAATLSQLGHVDLKDRGMWDLRLTTGERQLARAALGPLAAEPFIAVNTGGKEASKDWGARRWGALLAQLGSALHDTGLAFVGSTEDRDRAHRLGALWPCGPVVNLCGQLSPRASGAALERARMFVGHDSGPLHLADAVNTPAIGLFGAFNVPKKWHPSGELTHIIHRVDGMSFIAPTEVADLMTQLLSASH